MLSLFISDSYFFCYKNIEFDVNVINNKTNTVLLFIIYICNIILNMFPAIMYQCNVICMMAAIFL